MIHHRRAARPRRQAGFTLLEMIVVLVIIGLIMGLVGPRLFAQEDKAKVQTAQTQIKMLRGALQTMRMDVSRFPSEQEGLATLMRAPADERVARAWAGASLKRALPRAAFLDDMGSAPFGSGWSRRCAPRQIPCGGASK